MIAKFDAFKNMVKYKKHSPEWNRIKIRKCDNEIDYKFYGRIFKSCIVTRHNSTSINGIDSVHVCSYETEKGNIIVEFYKFDAFNKRFVDFVLVINKGDEFKSVEGYSDEIIKEVSKIEYKESIKVIEIE